MPVQLLNNISVTRWVLGTVEKMQEAGTEAASDWSDFWFKTCKELGGRSDSSGSKVCPKCAAYGLWFLGRLREGDRAFRTCSVPQVNRDLGKNAAYGVIASALLQQGAKPSVGSLWPLVQARYKKQTGQEPAGSEQGEIRLVVALFSARQLAVLRQSQV